MPDFNFNPNTTRWSAQNALCCGLASQLAYENQNKIQKVASNWGFPQTDFVNCAETETQSFVAGNDEMILIAFRGTEPGKIQDWMTDADIEQTAFVAGQAHEGFLWALNSVWDPLFQTLTLHQTRAQSLWFTGHSLGAALATLATAKLRLKYLKPVNGLYTFGSPRVGDTDFADAFDSDFERQAFRYVNNADVVTRVPPRVLGYSHTGTFLFFDEDGDLQSDIHWWNKFLEEVKGEMEEFLTGKLAIFEDHKMKNYIKRLRKNLRKKPC